MRTICTIDGVSWDEETEGGRVCALADADIDADGSPNAYAPENRGLDDLRNALDGRGVYVGLLTGRGGVPLRQAAGDPRPGNYISTTSYELTEAPRLTQRRYVDAEEVPFIVVPPQVVFGVSGTVLGCQARVTDRRSGLCVEAVVADLGPRTRCGEISIAAARALRVDADPRRGGEAARVFWYELWPGVPAVVAGRRFALQPARVAMA